MPDTIKVKRTHKPNDEEGVPTGEEFVYEGSFTYEFPTERGEDYEGQFETPKAMWQHELRALQNKIKQAAGSYLLTNEGKGDLQGHMDSYQIGERSAAGRKKEIKVTDDQLAAAGISTENMAALADILGIKLTVNEQDAEDEAAEDAAAETEELVEA